MNGRIEVRCSSGAVNLHDIEGVEVIVGSSANADISLPHLSDLDPRHMLLVPRGRRGCWVSVAKGVRTPVKLGDDVLTSALVPWGTDLRVGSIHIRPCLPHSWFSRISGWRVGLLVVALAGIALVTSRSVRKDDETAIENGGIQVPPLFAGTQPGCSSSQDAFHVGSRAEQVAQSRADRYPYDPRDGVRAVLGFETATSCYDLAGRPLDAGRTRVAGQELADRLGADYAAARLSLANAIESERWVDVLRDTRHLQLLTSHLEGHDYVEWLKKIIGKAIARHHDPP